MLIIGALIIPFFIYALAMHIKFSKSDNSTNEKGKIILAKSAKYAFLYFLLAGLSWNFITVL
ncbi:hypothetical protein X953_06350 [Virgibacillus sp. SK37]|nr:hypothetical protein X953_06350 [Virgibacillus sp. SK37]